MHAGSAHASEHATRVRAAQDHILCSAGAFELSGCTRDNTGANSYPHELVLPGLGFPSDHCIVIAELAPLTRGRG